VVGALIFIPAAVSLLKPRFGILRSERIAQETLDREAAAQAGA
jgi:hypothetical protein